MSSKFSFQSFSITMSRLAEEGCELDRVITNKNKFMDERSKLKLNTCQEVDGYDSYVMLDDVGNKISIPKILEDYWFGTSESNLLNQFRDQMIARFLEAINLEAKAARVVTGVSSDGQDSFYVAFVVGADTYIVFMRTISGASKVWMVAGDLESYFSPEIIGRKPRSSEKTTSPYVISAIKHKVRFSDFGREFTRAQEDGTMRSRKNFMRRKEFNNLID